MIKKIVFILPLLILFALSVWAHNGHSVSGQVTSSGKAVAGVTVSDGISSVRSDHNGRFSLPVEASSRFVYISTPSGYVAPVKDGVNRFFIPITPSVKSYDFALQKSPSDQTHHGFIAIADPQIWHKKEFALLSEAMRDIKSTVESYNGVPFHGIGCGDIVSSDHGLYDQYKTVTAESGLTFFNSMGNHDLAYNHRSNEGSQKLYEDTFGPAYYSFNVGNVHYVALNDNFYFGRDWFYIGYLPEQQLRWLEDDLSQVKPGSTVVVFMHIPSSCSPGDRKAFKYDNISTTLTNHGALYKMLAPYRTHIISGHMHTSSNQPISPTLYEHNMAALSGAWWQGELCTDGTPRGYGVYEVRGDSVVHYYKATGRPADHQMVLYSGDKVPEYNGYVVANIWNSDPQWRVELYEDGKNMGQMERFESYDPAAKAMYASTEKLDHKWIYPSKSDHFYRAPLNNVAKVIEVVATDRYGTQYKEILKQ